jgi:hypothetical protein
MTVTVEEFWPEVCGDLTKARHFFVLKMNKFRSTFSLLALVVWSLISLMLFYKVFKFETMQVVWSHATNSKAKLGQAVASHVMMIEADVSLGRHSIPT